jgi:acyl-CoA dehydrogenase
MISFTPSEEQQLIAETVRRYAAERLRPAAHEADERRCAPADVIAKGWDLGLLPSAIPEQYGGFGEQHAALTGALAAEELAHGDLALALYLLTPNLFALPILHCGTAEQKTTWLPKIAEGSFAPYTAALVEPRWDFDPRALQTTAERQGDAYRLTGHKGYVPLAADAPAMLVYAREGDATQAFIVERGAEGLTASRLGGEQGCDLELLLNYSRVALASLAVGVANGAYAYARDYARTREAFGKPIAQNQAIAFMLAEMAIEVEAARAMTWEAAWRLDQGQDAARAASLAKQYADEAALMVTDRAVQVLGGHGYIREHPVERWLRNARGFSTFLGLAMI